ncbi:MAG: DUF5908 family protein [Bacteroidota bacterium]
MPVVEILEMVVRASISEENEEKKNPPSANKPENGQAIDKQVLTEEIFAQVLAYLEHQTER